MGKLCVKHMRASHFLRRASTGKAWTLALYPRGSHVPLPFSLALALHSPSR